MESGLVRSHPLINTPSVFPTPSVASGAKPGNGQTAAALHYIAVNSQKIEPIAEQSLVQKLLAFICRLVFGAKPALQNNNAPAPLQKGPSTPQADRAAAIPQHTASDHQVTANAAVQSNATPNANGDPVNARKAALVADAEKDIVSARESVEQANSKLKKIGLERNAAIEDKKKKQVGAEKASEYLKARHNEDQAIGSQLDKAKNLHGKAAHGVREAEYDLQKAQAQRKAATGENYARALAKEKAAEIDVAEKRKQLDGYHAHASRLEAQKNQAGKKLQAAGQWYATEQAKLHAAQATVKEKEQAYAQAKKELNQAKQGLTMAVEYSDEIQTALR